MTGNGNQPNVLAIFRNIYHNEYHWALVKSFGLFIIGVRFAQECTGLDIMPAVL